MSQLETSLSELEDSNGDSGSASLRTDYEQQIRELTAERNRLEAQIKFGLDSFRVEQERARRVEEKLSKYVAI